ncbi:hypothetical protein H2198_010169 [Neophaeococcomyces mojaviensis]|uniref:Uncharacterized protein n=1 Tax=Neophaeococcomyces mojaviensis TaxID=3383035 RepID=A0ACC2ZSK5_9EURO|nr:hypothetical protein H2198_010169 [Knufia sp. JES_112]
MASEHSHARPISVVPKKDSGIFSPGYRPTLDDVLNGRAPAPYTLAAYTAFLSQQHCLETLEFVTEAKKYATKYDEASALYCGMPLTSESDEGFELMQDWVRMMDVYVRPGAPREINLPAEERDDLIEVSYDPKPPKPEALDPAVRRMRDLMSDSIFIPFCNSVKSVPHASTYNAFTELSRGNDLSDPSALTYDERGNTHRRQQSRRRRSPPTSSGFQPSRSPPQASNRSSALTSALNRNSSSRLSQHPSNTSGVSESALTDDSGSGGSPSAGDLDSTMTPPLTPPTSDMPSSQTTPQNAYTHAAKPSRSESGGWKKMGMKIFGARKKNSLQEEQ